MKTQCIIVLLSIILLSGTVSAQYDFESLNFNAGCDPVPQPAPRPPNQFCSFARGINDSGIIVGWGQLPIEEGFVIDKSGIPALISYPGADKTRASGINERGDIVGQYNDADGLHAFLRDKNGTYHNIDFPDSTFSLAWGISANGRIVGEYGLEGEPAGSAHAFVRNPNGSFESFDFPQSMVVAGDRFYTRFRDINDHGQIVGIYRVMNGNFPAFEVYGFLIDKKGKITHINYPVGPPTMGENFFATVPLGINNKGQISGGYIFFNTVTTPFSESGFVRTPKDGAYNTVNFPGAISTEIYKSTESGVLVGGWRNIDGESNAFVAYPSKP